MFYGIVAIAAVVGAGWLIRWLTKWKDASWDSTEAQSKAFLWSKRGGSGGGFGA